LTTQKRSREYGGVGTACVSLLSWYNEEEDEGREKVTKRVGKAEKKRGRDAMRGGRARIDFCRGNKCQ
jgi:hypothetical protein